MPEARNAVERDQAVLGDVESNGSTVCMIGGDGSLPSKMLRTKSRPDIDAMTSSGVTPYSIFGGRVIVHAGNLSLL